MKTLGCFLFHLCPFRNAHVPAPPLRLLLSLLILASIGHLPAQTLDDFIPYRYYGPTNVFYYPRSLAVQADGKVLVGGSGRRWTRVWSGWGWYWKWVGFSLFDRLSASGSHDSSFSPRVGPGNCMAVQADGKILVGGGTSRTNVWRLNADGTLDSSFSPVAGSGSNSYVSALTVQADGKILVGGSFTTLGGQTRNNLARLNADGGLDLGFNPGAGGVTNSLVNCLALQADGKILVAGAFTRLGGQTCTNLGRLNADGSLDSSFNAGAVSNVYCLAVQNDGKILVGGSFATLAGQTRTNLARLDADGSLDGSFDPGANSTVYCLALQTDGKILVAGAFTTLGGQTRSRIGRLNADGSLDGSFNPGAGGTVYGLAVQPDGKVLAGGDFITLAGGTRNGLGRLNNTDPATYDLTYGAATVTWARTGSGPEVWRTTFELSTNGSNWTDLGAASRVPGVGWQLTNVSPPAGSTIRARGYVTGGSYYGAQWFVEDYWGRPVILSQPSSRTNNGGTSAGFTALAGGSAVLSYQWLKDGAPLADGNGVGGTLTPSLTLNNVLKPDEGQYSVVVTNTFGSVTSQVATLRVNDPFIVSQPVGQNADPGQSATLSVTPGGTVPFAYQWLNDGVAVAQGTASSLTLTNLQGTDAGNYSVAVSNVYGVVTSAVAPLTVNIATLDNAFNPGAASSWDLYSLAVQADGKILVGGAFGTLDGEPRSLMGRLNADGSLDPNFNPGADNANDWQNAAVKSLALRPDGKILVGGCFTTLGGQTRTNLGCLDAEGGLDLNFDPRAGGIANACVNCLAVQADGKILVGGNFATLGGQARNYIGRLNADGSLDSSFNPGADDVVYCLAVQGDGKVLVGGSFATLGGQACNGIGRLNADGSLDASFNPGAGGSGGEVYCLAVQADGKILVGGSFTTLGGQTRNCIGRHNADGSVDSSFNPGADLGVYSLALQTDGKILVAGAFHTLGGLGRDFIGRLNADGSLDCNFNPGTDSTAYSLSVQPDGKILVGGNFLTLGGQTHNCIARLNGSGPTTHNLSYDGTTITWVRTGTGPEVWRTTLDLSTNGSDWVSLGAGSRVLGSGWQWTSVSLPAGSSIRARGYVTSGYQSGTHWFVEDYWGKPVILSQPASLTNDAGTSASFAAVAAGTQPLSYQWLKNGMPLMEGGGISGVLTPSLTLSNVFKPDEAQYRVVVTNASGSVTSLVATLRVIDPVITSQPLSQDTEPGQSATLSVTAAGTPPLRFQWFKDGMGVARGTAPVLTLTNLQGTDAGNYRVTVSNSYGTVTSAMAVLTVNLATLDNAFNPGATNDGGSGDVYSLAVQTDGKILVGGQFATLGGQARTNLGRLNADGSLDSDFNPGADSSVYSLAVQADGKILVGGYFTMLRGQARTNIGRLNADGSLDTGFNPGADYDVFSLAVQADGKILVGGYFTKLGGQIRNHIGRLNANGSLDSSFNPGADDYVNSLAVQADGKILVGGYFTKLGGQIRNHIGRLNANGSLDSSFNPGADSDVHSLAVQADGKILVGGTFTTLGGQPRNFIGRLNPDGSLDASFNPGATFWELGCDVYSLVLQADGKILVGGLFNTLGGQDRYGIGRLNADGSLDSRFNPGADIRVHSLAVQTDGKILAGGDFITLGGQTRYSIGRLNNTAPASQSLGYDGATITWLRGGSSPEVWRTTFESSTNGSDWTGLGAGSRVLGVGWQLTSVSLPAGSTIRARGYVTGGEYNGSAWFVQDYYLSGRPIIVIQPSSRTNDAGTSTRFTTVAAGTPPLAYQWLKNGMPLMEGNGVSGVLTPSLTLSNVFKPDEGQYSVLVTNLSGSVTSLVATLRVNDPAIISQPAGQNTDAGQSAALSVTAAGTQPLGYQWFKDGAAVAGGTAASLTLPNLEGTDAGNYSVTVSNVYGTVTSALAVLTVNFNPGTVGSSFLNPRVYALAVQADGKILVGGWFTKLGGQTRSCIGRVNADGILDTSFNPGADDYVTSLAVQADGKVLVAGYFTMLGGQARNYLGRFNADGTVDSSFNPGAYGGVVDCLALQADGKILVGGDFTTLGGQSWNFIGRLNADGSLDATFTPGADSWVASLAVQADGKILVGGDFTTLGGQSRNFIGRLNADGSLDATFNPGADSWVASLAVQADGKILVGGDFRTLGGQPRSLIGRVNANGSLDSTFNPGAAGAGGWFTNVFSLAVQADGKILVGGAFTTLGGQARNYIGRLNADGSLDASFGPGADSTIYALAVQADGNILVGGEFTMLGGQTRIGIGRLNNTEPATHNLSYNGSTITWLRTGTGPEVWRSTFESSTNGSDWTGLGAGSRVLGVGWQLTDVSLPAGSTIRARGYVTGGEYNASAWFVEDYYFSGRPIILSQPSSRTNNAGTSARFAVVAGGTQPLSYQWLKNGMPLMEGNGVSGALTPSLSLSSVFKPDEGQYSVMVTNVSGSVTSLVATLQVNDPVIISQPAGQNTDPGQTATLSVTAAGTQPLSYQWFKDGAAVAHGTASTLTLTNLQGTDAGNYSVAVRNVYGSVTSAVALLTVNLATLENAFNPGADDWLTSLAVQADGNILVVGYFTTLGGQPRDYVGRLNADGSLDNDFNPGADSWMYAIALQADGKIVVGGHFTMLGGQTRYYVGRLNPDGSLDSSFNLGADSTVYCLALQADGSILVGGEFSTLGGQTCNHIGRLNADGSLDSSFNGGADSRVLSLMVQGDGNILLGGSFTNLGGQTRNYIGRLNTDGSLDSSFNPGADSDVFSLAVQADGKILVGGAFTTLGGQTRNKVGRLNADGSLDSSFNPGADPGADFFVSALAVQGDGKVLAGGYFSMLGGQPRDNIGRLNNTTPATQALSYDGWSISWLRGGSSPEVYRTAFDFSTNGVDWASLGAGTRGPAPGWQYQGVSLPPTGALRARGFTAGGFCNSSSWFVEETLPMATAYAPVPVIQTRDGALGFASGTFGFNLSGPAGLAVVIEASTNLINWVPIQTNALINGQVLFSDPQARLFAQRFYRASFASASSDPPLLHPAWTDSATGRFGFELEGMRGQTVVFEASTNLVDWTPVWTNSLLTGYYCFSAPWSAVAPCCFYRACVTQ